MVDLLAWQRATRTLLVVEIKTVLASSEEMLRRLDTKTRLGPIIARRFGWRPVAPAGSSCSPRPVPTAAMSSRSRG